MKYEYTPPNCDWLLILNDTLLNPSLSVWTQSLLKGTILLLDWSFIRLLNTLLEE